MCDQHKKCFAPLSTERIAIPHLPCTHLTRTEYHVYLEVLNAAFVVVLVRAKGWRGRALVQGQALTSVRQMYAKGLLKVLRRTGHTLVWMISPMMPYPPTTHPLVAEHMPMPFQE